MYKYVFSLIFVLTCSGGIYSAYGGEKIHFESVEVANDRRTSTEQGGRSEEKGDIPSEQVEWDFLDDDEWKILDKAESVSEVDENAQSPETWSYTRHWSFSTAWQQQWEKTTVFQPVLFKDPYYLSLFAEGDIQVWKGEKLRLSVSGGAEFTTKEKEKFQQEHPSVPEEELRYFSYVYPSFHELALYYKFNDMMSLETGLLPIRVGNSLLFNPINYLERFSDDPLVIGAYTFCGTRLFVSRSSYNVSLTYFPALVKKQEESSFLSRIFHLGRTDNFMVLQSNHYFWGGRLSLVGFLEEKMAWTWDTPYWGIGLETQFPLSSLVLNAQSFWSTGEAISTLQEIEGLPGERFFLPDDASLEECFLETFFMITAPLGSRLDFGIGYKYNDRGLRSHEQEALFETLKNMTNLDVLRSATGLGDSALPYVRHLGVIQVTYPQLTKNSYISTQAFVNLEDGSGEFFGSYGVDIGANMQMTLLGRRCFGSADSLFGTNVLKTIFNVSFKISF